MTLKLNDGRVLEEGDQVVLTVGVDRFPDCLVKQGETATVVYADEDAVEVVLDAYYPGLKEWGNKVIWTEWNYDDGLRGMVEDLSTTLADVERAPIPGA